MPGIHEGKRLRNLAVNKDILVNFSQNDRNIANSFSHSFIGYLKTATRSHNLVKKLDSLTAES